MNKNLSFVYVAAGLLALTLMMALFTFMFSGYLVTYALLPEKDRSSLFENPQVIQAYGSQPIIGPLINYTSPNQNNKNYFLKFVTWGPEGIGEMVLMIRPTSPFSVGGIGMTSPAGERFGAFCGRALR